MVNNTSTQLNYTGRDYFDAKMKRNTISEVRAIPSTQCFQGLTVVVTNSGTTEIPFDMWLVGGSINKYWKVKQFAPVDNLNQIKNIDFKSYNGTTPNGTALWVGLEVVAGGVKYVVTSIDSNYNATWSKAVGYSPIVVNNTWSGKPYYKIRRGKTLDFAWTPQNFSSGHTYSVVIREKYNYPFVGVQDFEVTDDGLTFTWEATKQRRLGIYGVTCTIDKGTENETVDEYSELFELVATEEEEGIAESVPTNIEITITE